MPRKSAPYPAPRLGGCKIDQHAPDDAATAGTSPKALQLAEESRRLSSKKEFQAAIEKAKLSAEVHAAVYGADHPATIREQISVGWMTIRQGNKSAGQKIIDDAVRKEQAVFGDNAIDSLSTYRLVARFALDGDAASAEKWYRKVFAVLDKKYAKNKTELVAARQHELQTLVSAGDMGIARTFCQQTLDRIQELGMVGSELEAIEFTNMAAILTQLGEVDGALKYYQRALNVPEEAMSAQLRATVLAFIGEIYRDQQEYLEADKYMTQAVAFSRRGYGEKHTTTARHLFTLGWNKYFLADYESGIELLNECLAIRKTLPQDDSLDVANTYTQLGYIYTMAGRVAEGVACFRNAIDAAGRVRDEQSTAMASYYRALGFGLSVVGDPEAGTYLKKSVAIYEAPGTADGRPKAEAFRRYANYLEGRGRYDQAERYLTKALAITSQHESMDAYDAMNRRAMAELHVHRREYPEAISMMSEAIRKLSRTHKPNHQSLLQLRVGIAGVQQYQGNLAAAEEGLKELVPLYKEAVGEHPGTVDALTRLAQVQHGRGKHRKALETFSDARHINFKYLQQQLAMLAPHQQIAYLASRNKTQLHKALEAAFENDEPTAPKKFVEWLLNGKAVSHESLAAYYRRRLIGRKPPARVWRTTRELQAQLPRGSCYVDLVKVTSADQATGNNQGRYLAAVVTPGDLRLTDLGPSDIIDKAVMQAKTVIVESGLSIRNQGEESATQRCNESLLWITGLVWKKLPLVDKFDTIFLSPDSALWMVPWSALPHDLSGNEVLLESHDVRLLVTGRDLFSKPSGPRPERSLIIANPDFGTFDRTESDAEGFFARFAPVKQLHFAGLEAAGIAQHLSRMDGTAPRLLTGQAAVEGAVEKANSPKHLVFSTHGVFFPDGESRRSDNSDILDTLRGVRSADDPASWNQISNRNPLLRSGLVLAGFNSGNTESGDGVLTGREIVGLRLDGTELVVLSACDTAVGDIQSGEGVGGLRQAFQLAGAEQVVASLWSVDDEQTARLMVEFYRKLAAGDSVAKALRNAKLARIESRRKRNGAAHPFFWAAFTLTGKGS